MNMRNFINVILLGILIFFGVDKFGNLNLIDKFYLPKYRVLKKSFNNEKIKSKEKKLSLNQRFSFDKYEADYFLFLFLIVVPLIIIWSIPYSNEKK